MLKPLRRGLGNTAFIPAAFGRLCVETLQHKRTAKPYRPAAFGRLCVETNLTAQIQTVKKPAAFGRLCVETVVGRAIFKPFKTSRLRAAVC